MSLVERTLFRQESPNEQLQREFSVKVVLRPKGEELPYKNPAKRDNKFYEEEVSLPVREKNIHINQQN